MASRCDAGLCGTCVDEQSSLTVALALIFLIQSFDAAKGVVFCLMSAAFIIVDYSLLLCSSITAAPSESG